MSTPLTINSVETLEQALPIIRKAQELYSTFIDLSLFVFLDEGSSFRCVDSFFVRLVESCFY